MTRSTNHRIAHGASRLFTLVFIALAALTAASAAERATSQDAFVAANAAASRGDHAAAVAAFESVIAQEGWSANALLGLANAYSSAGDQGHAVLALERARLISPRDPAILTNLARIREAAGVDPPASSRVETTLALLTADTWTWLALGGLTAACAAVVALAYTRRGRRAVAAAGIVGATMAIGAGVAAHHVAPAESAVVVIKSEPARIAPFDDADHAFAARAGETGAIEQRRGTFVYVRVPEGAGWLPSDAVATVIPSDHPTDAR